MRSALRIGVLGAAPLAAVALVRPSRRMADVEIAAVAARDPARARRFAGRYGIAHVHASYTALIADPAIDAIYLPLPNSLHAAWTIKALQAGKHVLCEKPLAANALEATEVARVAHATGRVVMEAFHYRYHPLAHRLKTIIDSGEIGHVMHLDAEFGVPLLRPNSIQYRYELGGGATMDVGCYAINLIRYLADSEPEVIQAQPRLIRPNVDRYMAANFRFADGRTAHMVCALLSTRLLRLSATVHGTVGKLHVTFPFLPHLYNHIIVRGLHGDRHEHVEGLPSYAYQLRAFADAVRIGTPVPTSATDAVKNMQVIDAVYRAAGLHSRGFLAAGSNQS
ncbi:MAG: Gfo/Idh/MocA family oxidoreductase [Herpetosiphonaceae bacterium]|nr:Gfo/Idh/MocA family oxidoreductase [Herpetosiphonaceae bacterium]